MTHSYEPYEPWIKRMIEHDRKIIHSSEESNWRTPPKCYERLKQSFNFVLDLAADKDSSLCGDWLGPGSMWGEDALKVDWHIYAHVGAMFLNPPYSKKLSAAYRTGKIMQDGVVVPHEKNQEKADALEIESWAAKCWEESQKGCRIVSILPFAPQTDWYKKFVYGHYCIKVFHAAMEEWRLAHRISFLRPDGQPASNAGVNSVVVIWRPNPGFIGPWQPAVRYWSYR